MALKTLEFDLCSASGERTVQISITQLIVAGWTGRDEAAVQHHVEELAAIGIPRPKTTPIFYRVSSSRLIQAPNVEMIGAASSGEAECMLLQHEGETWVGLGSDHTDREAETHGITLSKQMCDKPVARTLWAYADVKDHWDQLILQSFIQEEGKDVLYQDGTLAALRSPEDLIGRYCADGRLPDGTAMFCGTHAAIGGIRPASPFTMVLKDPVLDREIRHQYRVISLPVEG